jgi:hypothetical protein
MRDGLKRLVKGPYWDSAAAQEPEPITREQWRREVRGLIAVLALVLGVGGYWLIGTHHHGRASGVAAETVLAVWVLHTARLGWVWFRIRRRRGG